MAIEMAGSIKVNKDEISNLKKGNVLYYRLVSS